MTSDNSGLNTTNISLAANSNKTALDMEIAAYDEQRKIDDAMALHIANRMASPCIPHYDHMRQADKMVKYIKDVADLKPKLKNLQDWGLLK